MERDEWGQDFVGKAPEVSCPVQGERGPHCQMRLNRVPPGAAKSMPSSVLTRQGLLQLQERSVTSRKLGGGNTSSVNNNKLNPHIHFLAFPRELIIRNAGNLEEGRKNAAPKPGSFSAVSGKIQFCTCLHQTSQAWPVVVFQLLSVTFEIQTFFDPSSSAASALSKLSASLHGQDATVTHAACADGRCATAPADPGPEWGLEGM